MKQKSLATAGFELATKRTRKRKFLYEMNMVVPWSELVGLVQPHAPAAAASFGLVLVLTQQEVAQLDARLRTATTMALACAVALTLVSAQGSWQLNTGWLGLSLLTALYGTGITLLLAVLPRLGVVGNSPILNIEPVVALVLAWHLLGQTIAPMQIVGSLVVVGVVIALGLRKR